jgi:hypothetical protein
MLKKFFPLKEIQSFLPRDFDLIRKMLINNRELRAPVGKYASVDNSEIFQWLTDSCKGLVAVRPSGETVVPGDAVHG